MDGGHAVLQEVAALGGAPLDAQAPDGFLVIAGGLDRVGQFHGNVDGEGLRQEVHLAGRGEGLQAREMGTVMPAARQWSTKR